MKFLSHHNYKLPSTLFLSKALFFFSLFFVIYLLSNYQVVWDQPENLFKREFILNKTYQNLAELFHQTFNWQLWENGAPRFTRLLSSFFDLIDIFFRDYFISHIFPHPSISLSWFFNLIFSPIILYKILRILRCDYIIIFCILAIYFSFPGTLSLMVMGFRTGKSLAIFLLLTVTYLLLKKSIQAKQADNKVKNNLFTINFLIILSYIISLFADEIAVFGLFLIIVINKYHSIKSFFLPIIVVVFTFFYFLFTQTLLPDIHAWFNFPIVCEVGVCQDNQYHMMAKLTDLFLFKHNFFDFINSLMLNMIFAIKDITGIGLLWANRWSFSWMIGLIHMSSLIYFIFKFNQSRFRNLSDNLYILRGISGFQILLLFCFALIFHGILIWLTPHNIWGIYWYGVFLSIPFLIGVSFIFSKLLLSANLSKIYFVIFSFLLICANFKNFISTNYALKDYYFYPYRAHLLSDVFSGKINKFDLTMSRYNRFDLFNETNEFINSSNGIVKKFSLELRYLLAETHQCSSKKKFDYLHILEINQDKIIGLCFYEYIPFLLKEMKMRMSSLPNSKYDLYARFIGLYDDRVTEKSSQISFIHLSKDGELFVVNGFGHHSTIELFGQNQIYAKEWNLKAKFDTNNDKLIWENGSVWIKKSK